MKAKLIVSKKIEWENNEMKQGKSNHKRQKKTWKERESKGREKMVWKEGEAGEILLTGGH